MVDFCNVNCGSKDEWDDCMPCVRDKTAPCNLVGIFPVKIKSTSDPTVNDDENDGYKYFDIWLNTSDNGVFICVDPTATAAVWREFSFV